MEECPDLVNQLKNDCKQKDMTILNLQLLLKFEMMKNKIYCDIIESQTDINLCDIIKESKSECNIYNYNGKIPIIVHDFVNKNQVIETYTLQTSKPKKKVKKTQICDAPELVIVDCSEDLNIPDLQAPQPANLPSDNESEKKNKVYRTVKKYIKTSEKEFDIKLQKDVERVDKEIEKIVYNNFDVSHKEITDKIEELFTQITTTRSYTSSLISIQSLRKKLLGKLKLVEYIDVIYFHIKRLETIFSNKKYSNKKTVKIISKSLTPLDMRFVSYTGYSNIPIDVDEIQKFGLALDILIEHKKQFLPFDKKLLYHNINNYGLALFELQECIERCIVNRYGFHTIIYLPEVKSSKKDPYSFYSLTKVIDKRLWKMECRLEDFVTDFIDNILPFCISLFKKIYKDVFSDNVYRKDYACKSQITEFDCEQLLQNIILLGSPMKLCKIFQTIVTSNCTLTATELDKFNLYADDKFQQKKFSRGECCNGDDINSIIKRLFDEITKEEIEKLVSKYSY
jgi:hypothetical protein